MWATRQLRRFGQRQQQHNNKPSPATLRRASFLVREPAKLTAEEAVHRSVQPETHNGDVASSAPAAAGAMAAAKQHATIPLHAPEVLAVAFTAHSNGEGAVAQRTEAAATTTNTVADARFEIGHVAFHDGHAPAMATGAAEAMPSNSAVTAQADPTTAIDRSHASRSISPQATSISGPLSITAIAAVIAAAKLDPAPATATAIADATATSEAGAAAAAKATTEMAAPATEALQASPFSLPVRLCVGSKNDGPERQRLQLICGVRARSTGLLFRRLETAGKFSSSAGARVRTLARRPPRALFDPAAHVPNSTKRGFSIVGEKRKAKTVATCSGEALKKMRVSVLGGGPVVTSVDAAALDRTRNEATEAIATQQQPQQQQVSPQVTNEEVAQQQQIDQRECDTGLGTWRRNAATAPNAIETGHTYRTDAADHDNHPIATAAAVVVTQAGLSVSIDQRHASQEDALPQVTPTAGPLATTTAAATCSASALSPPGGGANISAAFDSIIAAAAANTVIADAVATSEGAVAAAAEANTEWAAPETGSLTETHPSTITASAPSATQLAEHPMKLPVVVSSATAARPNAARPRPSSGGIRAQLADAEVFVRTKCAHGRMSDM